MSSEKEKSKAELRAMARTLRAMVKGRKVYGRPGYAAEAAATLLDLAVEFMSPPADLKAADKVGRKVGRVFKVQMEKDRPLLDAFHGALHKGLGIKKPT